MRIVRAAGSVRRGPRVSIPDHQDRTLSAIIDLHGGAVKAVDLGPPGRGTITSHMFAG